MRTKLLVLSSLLFACGGGAASAHTARTADGRYEVHLTRQAQVGLGWDEVVHYSGTQHQTVRVNGTPLDDTSSTTTIEFAGEYTILESDARGQPSRLRVAVRQLTIDAGQGPTTPAIPSVLLVVRGVPGTITGEQGEALDAGTAAALANVIPVRSHPTDDDQVFGSREPQAVGASWAIDAASAAGGLGELGLTVDPANITGSTLLEGASTEAGVDCITLRSTIAASHVGVPNLPPGSVEQHADLQATVEFLLPLDRSLPPLRDVEHSTVDIEVAVVTQGGPGIVDVTMTQDETHHRTLH
jgi:hypothetical protein